MRNASTLLTFFAVLALTVFSVIVIWPSYPDRYLPGDFWPSGNGFSLGGVERETMRLGLDLQGGAHLVLEANPPADYEGDLDAALDVAKDVIENRVNEFGVSESEVTRASGNRIVVQVPGLTLTEAENLIGATASLEFRVIDGQGNEVPATGFVDGQELAMTGAYLKNNAFADRTATDFAVVFETTSIGAQLLGQITSRALDFSAGDPQRLLLVYLDDQNVSTATVNGVITDQGTITGLDSFSEADTLAKQLNAGALPVPLRTVQSNEVSATLGDDSVRNTVRAGEVGLLAVALFMILYYRLPGLLATAALAVYTALALAVFKLWPVTLTLSGIAAFVLSVGMAVDANILIFERMKEELRRGRTLNTAIDIGFRRAWSSIRDSNISTLITCAILFWFGDQFGAALVKGFALTLAIGVLLSMFSAITVSRTFLKMLVGTSLARNPWLWNASEERRRDDRSPNAEPHGLIHFAEKRWWYLSASMLAFVTACVILVIPPALKGGIEFTSGSTFTFSFDDQFVEQADLRDALSDLGYPEARVQGSGENSYLIRTRVLEGAPALEDASGPIPPGEIDDLQGNLEERFGAITREDFQTVSSTVSSEIVRASIGAVLAAAVAILIYIWISFRHLHQPWKFGAAAVIALTHDTFIVLGLFSFLGKVAGTEVDTAFITALLTVIGFSVHDTIVVFDRMREKLAADPLIPFEEAVNASLTETLARSLNTSITVVLTVLALLLLGGVTIQNFLIVLLVGIAAGTYSSIAVASQVLVVWENGDIPRFFRRVFGRDEREIEGMEPGQV
ncbi:MAG: protein translocase subunit SecD [Dehalococcoidia bacterium]